MRILVLGDCASNGNNTMSHLIRGDDNTISQWSVSVDERMDTLQRWFLKEVSKRKDFTETINLNDLGTQSLKYIKQRELNAGWPSMLDPNWEVFNLSKNGNHFARYTQQLVDWQQEHGDPDLVLVTDYTWSHVYFRFANNGTKYSFTPSFRLNGIKEYTGKESYPKNIHSKLKNSVDSYLKLSLSEQWNFCMKSHRRHFLNFKKHLNNLTWMPVHIWPEFKTFWDDAELNVINISSIHKSYRVNSDYMILQGEYCKKKLELQQSIADVITKNIKSKIH